MVEIIKLEPDQQMGTDLSRIADVVRQGGVIAYPTDTFYGLGCDPFNTAAIDQLFAIKQRERGQPILLIISDPSLVVWLTSERDERFERLSQQFWPGPLTLVLRASERLPATLTGQTGTIGIRLPDHDLCRRIVNTAGGVLTGTSANVTGQPSAATAEAVLGQLGDAPDLIVDGGPTSGGAPSTVLDLTQEPPQLVREGVVSWHALKNFI